MSRQRAKKIHGTVPRQVELRITPPQWQRLDLRLESNAERIRQSLYTLWDLEDSNEFMSRVDINLKEQPTGYDIRLVATRDLKNYGQILSAILPTLNLDFPQSKLLCDALNDEQTHLFQDDPKSYILSRLEQFHQVNDSSFAALIQSVQLWSVPQAICALDAVTRFWIHRINFPLQDLSIALHSIGLVNDQTHSHSN
jgi:hypothetical protein